MTDLTTIPLAELIAEIRRRDGLLADPIGRHAAEIVAAESDSSGIGPTVILSRVRSSRVVAARHRCMTALYHRGFSSTAVGQVFNRTHGAVMNAVHATA